jgi:hypothetical protein
MFFYLSLYPANTDIRLAYVANGTLLGGTIEVYDIQLNKIAEGFNPLTIRLPKGLFIAKFIGTDGYTDYKCITVYDPDEAKIDNVLIGYRSIETFTNPRFVVNRTQTIDARVFGDLYYFILDIPTLRDYLIEFYDGDRKIDELYIPNHVLRTVSEDIYNKIREAKILLEQYDKEVNTTILLFLGMPHRIENKALKILNEIV